jgi:acetaldehyde dehydrogenase
MDDGAPKVVFDATSASSHSNHVELIEGRDIRCIDLTPAALGPGVVPDVNLSEHADAKDMSLVTCAAQATVPIVAGLAQVMDVGYVETVSTIASRSAGPGTRNNIDEFTFATSRALETIGGAKRGKASVILNPADPPITMRNTIVVELDVGTAASATERTEEVVHRLQAFVPGYALAGRPSVGEDTLTIFTSVTGAGDFLPPFAGNLDIMTSAAVRVAESLADESIHL